MKNYLPQSNDATPAPHAEGLQTSTGWSEARKGDDADEISSEELDSVVGGNGGWGSDISGWLFGPPPPPQQQYEEVPLYIRGESYSTVTSQNTSFTAW